jgi:hypothetical protein
MANRHNGDSIRREERKDFHKPDGERDRFLALFRQEVDRRRQGDTQKEGGMLKRSSAEDSEWKGKLFCVKIKKVCEILKKVRR